jgi:hypothetical protein
MRTDKHMANLMGAFLQLLIANEPNNCNLKLKTRDEKPVTVMEAVVTQSA